ncbi:MAG: hypothetical protein F6K35_35625 [Okeania sp. SIO2H7]|nr:hypothetical protein [Okeania sp. SIO2H7]
MSEHPFSLTASQLQEILAPEDDQRPIVPPGDAPPEVIATAGGSFFFIRF